MIKTIKNLTMKTKIQICILGFVLLGACIALCSCVGGKAVLSDSVDSTSAMATVNSIDGNTLKVNVMPMMGDMQGGQGGPGDMQGGQGGQGGPGDMQGGQGGTPPAKPDGDSGSNSGQSGQNGNSQNSGSQNSGQNGNSQNSGSQNSGQNQSQGGTSSGNSSSTPPAKPDGESNSGSGDTPPDLPQGGQGGSGGMQAGQGGSGGMQAGQGMGGSENTLTINDASVIEKSDGSTGGMSDISQGTNLQLTIDGGKNVTKIVISEGMGGMGNGGQQSSGTVNNGTSAITFSEDTTKTNENFVSSNTDENAVRADNGATATLENCTFEKSGDTSSNEDSDFYGLNAIAYVWNKAKMILNGGTLTSNSKGSNALFVYGEGSAADVKDLKITTSADNSGGIEVSGGGTINASNLDVDTQGGSSAAIRSDRGGGTETVSGGSYKAHGQGSPAIYCTADVSVNNAYLESETSEVNVIEGKNSISLDGCTLNCNTQGQKHRGDNIRNIMLYQSMSGDAEQGTCNYTAKNCNYTANHGNIFYITNTSAVVNLENSVFSGAYEAFMKVAGNTENWGKEGSNGGDVTLNCSNQTIKGAITVDDVSKLQMNFSNNSKFEGSINSQGAHGSVSLNMDANSTFTLTEDTYVSSLDGDTTGINLNGHTLYVNGQAWSK